jgi:hypothetical protein
MCLTACRWPGAFGCLPFPHSPPFFGGLLFFHDRFGSSDPDRSKNSHRHKWNPHEKNPEQPRGVCLGGFHFDNGRLKVQMEAAAPPIAPGADAWQQGTVVQLTDPTGSQHAHEAASRGAETKAPEVNARSNKP